jgi:hypothetical protein
MIEWESVSATMISPVTGACGLHGVCGNNQHAARSRMGWLAGLGTELGRLVTPVLPVHAHP